MRPGLDGPSAAAPGGFGAPCFWRRDSPLPYLFGGLAVMTGLIAAALIILACANRKSSSSLSHGDSADAGDMPRVLVPLDMEPKIVVIMPGDAIPRCLAKAVPAAQPGEP